MLRKALLPTLMAACALAGACSRAPSVRIEGHPVDGTRPTLWLLRCIADGFVAPVKTQWKLAVGVKPVGGNVPLDESTTIVQPPERMPAWAQCTVTGADGTSTHAVHSLTPIAIGAAPTTAKVGELLLVRGSGFGNEPNRGDGVWLVPPWGRALAADATCKRATWSDAAVSACVPAAARGRTWSVRVQSADTLAIAPKPLVVAP